MSPRLFPSPQLLLCMPGSTLNNYSLTKRGIWHVFLWQTAKVWANKQPRKGVGWGKAQIKIGWPSRKAGAKESNLQMYKYFRIWILYLSDLISRKLEVEILSVSLSFSFLASPNLPPISSSVRSRYFQFSLFARGKRVTKKSFEKGSEKMWRSQFPKFFEICNQFILKVFFYVLRPFHACLIGKRRSDRG